MTGGEFVLRCMLAQGVEVGFGIPGALNAPLYDALHRVPEFRHVLVRHELGGGWMADGFARARNDVGVAFTIPGPGATHAASAVAGAWTDNSRLLLVTAQSETRLRGELRRDLFHGLDAQRLFAPITRWTAAVRRVEELPEALAEAFARLRSGRPGPVHLEIPIDVLAAEAGALPVPERAPFRPAPPPAAAVRAAEALLRSARRPLLWAGDGVLHAPGGPEALQALAASLRAPVVTSVMGKGALPEDSPWSLGDSHSAAGSAAYREHDLLLALGERFAQVDTRWSWFFPPRRLVHVDADAREIGRLFPPEVGIVGDPAAAMAALAGAFRKEPLPPRGSSGWEPLLPELRRQHELPAADPILAAVRAALPREALVVFDVCLQGFRSRSEWRVFEPRSYFYPGVYVGMGFGLPAGIGVRLARPERPVCVVAGDGGFQMTLPELATALQHRIPLVLVVVNDSGYGLIREVQDRAFGGRRCAVDLVNPDFVALAGAYGLPAERVEGAETLPEAVERALARETLTLVECRAPAD